MTENDQAEPKMIKCVVAHGRSLITSTDEKVPAGWAPGPDGVEPVLIFKFVQRTYLPGEEIFLSEDEVVRLIESGFVENPNNPGDRLIQVPSAWLEAQR